MRFWQAACSSGRKRMSSTDFSRSEGWRKHFNTPDTRGLAAGWARGSFESARRGLAAAVCMWGAPRAAMLLIPSIIVPLLFVGVIKAAGVGTHQLQWRSGVSGLGVS